MRRLQNEVLFLEPSSDELRLKQSAEHESVASIQETEPNQQEAIVASIAQEYSLFEIDRELDTLVDEIEEEIENRGETSTELLDRFQQFCEAHGEKAFPSHDGSASPVLPK